MVWPLNTRPILIDVKIPRITCLIFDETQVEAYLRQTYPLLNLVFITSNTAYQPRHKDVILTAPSMSVATLKNTAIELAAGNLVCIWNGSDFTSDIIMRQYLSLRADVKKYSYWKEGSSSLLFYKSLFSEKGIIYCDGDTDESYSEKL